MQDTLTVGAIRFPFGETCDVPAFASEQQFAFATGAEFLARWEELKVGPEGSTPLGQAMLAAAQAIADASEAGLLDDRFRVIIVTDGEPNCDADPALLTALPAQWHERGVETHVLGLPGSTGAVELLDAIAEAGGGHHRALLTVSELNEETRALAL